MYESGADRLKSLCSTVHYLQAWCDPHILRELSVAEREVCLIDLPPYRIHLIVDLFIFEIRCKGFIDLCAAGSAFCDGRIDSDAVAGQNGSTERGCLLYDRCDHRLSGDIGENL